MFETVWHGTNGGMGAKGVGLMDPTDPKNGITPDELLKIIAWVRSMGSLPRQQAKQMFWLRRACYHGRRVFVYKRGIF